MRPVQTTLERFALTIHKILKSDRDCLMAVGGFTGEGKSCLLTQLQKKYAELSGTAWSFENMTWERSELLKWIDGEGENQKGRKPQYTAIMSDELISMFYRRNWYADPQKEAIELFNKCRDRHLFIGGNVPDFWDLDTGFQKRVRFYVYIYKRGIAWVFEQENNPFSADPWNVNENKKGFRKQKNPYKLPNFVTEVRFNDWTPEDKEAYYKIRNKKRRNTENQNQKSAMEQKAGVKQYAAVDHRNKLIRYVLNQKLMAAKDVAELMQMRKGSISKIHRGERGKSE